MSKKLYSVYCTAALVFIFVLSAVHTKAQVIARFRANGVEKQNGDTIFVCRGNTVTYKDSSFNATSIAWTFKNGSPVASAATTVPVQYNTIGIDSTILIVRNGPDIDSRFVFVKVSDERPTAGFGFSPNGVCGNTFFSFTNTSTGNPVNYLWNFGDGVTSTLTNPTHQFLNAIGPPGTSFATVTLTAINIYGCTNQNTQTITVRNVPDPAITCTNAEVNTYQGLTVFRKCEDLPSYVFNFINNSTTTASNTQYTINWGDGSPDATFTTWPASINHTYTQGIHTILVKVINSDGCENERRYLVFLGTNPQGGIPSPGATVACAPLTKTFDIVNVATNPTGTIYTFNINDGTTYTFTHPPPPNFTHTFTQSSCGLTSATGLANSFSVEWIISNPCEPPSTGAIASIYISDKPRARINILPDTIVCTGTTVTFQNVSLGGNEITFSGATSTCTPVRKIVWEITPATGWTPVAGSTGSTGGSTNVNTWVLGTNNLSVNFTTPGVYQIKLYAGNKCGIDTSVRTICVRIPPAASFTKSLDSSCGPATVQFTNTSPAGGCRGDLYNWQVQFSDPLNCSNTVTPPFEFVNSTTPSSVSPEIFFKKPGRFIITLSTRTNGGACPQAMHSDTFIVKGPPKVILTPPGTICLGDSITPQATVSACYSNGPLSCSWTLIGGFPNASPACSPGRIVYNNTGDYPISITVTDASCGLDTTVTDTLHVINAPQANAGPDTSFCSGDTIQIGPAPQSGVTYLWTPATGLSNPNIANPLISLTYNGPNNADTIAYSVEISGGPGCKGRDTINIIVKRKPLVTVTPDALTLCKDSSITLHAAGADSYLWAPGGAATPSITVNPTVTTNYIVTGTLAATGCAAKDTAIITVTDKARAEFTLTDSVYCVDVDLNTAVMANHYPALNLLYTWYINGVPNNPNTTGAPPNSIITTPAASFTLKLVTTSIAGCAPDSMQKTFRTKPARMAQFSKSDSAGCGPLTINFTNLSEPPPGNAGQYWWDFGNSTSSTVFQPGPVTYTSNPSFTDTTYYITLRVYDGCDTTMYRDSIKVRPGPSARFSILPTTGCSPFNFTTLNNSLGNNIAYYWDFDDGFLDSTFLNSDTINHTYITSVIDTFRIRLIAENNCGRDTQYLSVIVSPGTIQPIIVIGGPSLSGCAPHNAIFTNNSLGAVTLLWNYGDGSTPEITLNSQSTITHLYSSPGIYNVSIRLRNDCTDTTVFRQITVYPKPLASFTLNRNLICPGDSVTVTSTATNANAVEWLWGDGSSGGGNTALHIYNTAGVYNIRLVAKRVNNFGLVCSDTSAPVQLTVQANIPAIINITSSPKRCAPYTLSVIAQGAAGASIARWTFYDPNVPGGQVVINGLNASYLFNQPGNYAVKLFTQNTAGCQDSVMQNLVVYPVPVADFTPDSLSTCLSDTVVRYTATYTYAWPDPISLQWFVNGQPVGTGNILNYLYRLPAGATRPYTFTVTLLPQNAVGCGDSLASAALTMKPVPKPGIKVLPGYVLQQPRNEFNFSDSVAANPNYIYNWDLGDRSPFRAVRSFVHNYRDTGTYKVRLRVSDFLYNCSGYDSASVTLLYVPGYLYVPNAFYPNSQKAELKVFKPFGIGLESYHLRIYDTWGRLLFETRLLDPDGKPVEAWNGKDLQQKEMGGDVYVWVIDARFKNGVDWNGMVYDRNPASGPVKKPTRQGFVRILR